MKNLIFLLLILLVSPLRLMGAIPDTPGADLYRALVPGSVDARGADLYRALVPDSVHARGDDAVLLYLDSLSVGTDAEANVAAGLAAFLKGSEELGVESLRVAVGQGAIRGDAVAAAAVFLDRYERDRQAQEYALNEGSNALVAFVVVLLFVAGFAAGLIGARIWRRRKGTEPGAWSPESPTEDAARAGSMLMLALNTLERYRDFNVLVERKLAAGQGKDLYEIVAKGKQESRTVEAFFEDFDQAFLAAYPGYIAALNGLLKPDRRFDEGLTSLTPELRIGVLMSFGIDSSQKISELLGLSLNTVYTYRNRLKGRASDRQNIEKQLPALIY